MKSRQLHNVSEDGVTVSRRHKQSKTSLINDSENSLPIPIDLVMEEIFLRLPVKSIGRSRCVSKFWASVLGGPDFTDLFLTKSSAHPQLLFACSNKYGFVFFSSHQPQNVYENSSAIIAATHLTSVPRSCNVDRPVNGLVCLRGYRILEGSKKPAFVSVIFICNPYTGESLTLPIINTSKRTFEMNSFLGYEPIEKQFKVLSMRKPDVNCNCEEYQVLTLGNVKLSWRMTECSMPHIPRQRSEICINGVLYYLAGVNESYAVTMVVCFDVRSEKFSFVKDMETFNRALPRTATLINYNGKLGLLMTGEYEYAVSGKNKSFELWILRDAGKDEWSKHIYVLPPLWKNVVADTKLHFVGMIGTNEIVLFPCWPPYMSFNAFYYNIERNTIIRVGIQGMEAFKRNGLFIFLNHVETVKLIQA